MKFTDSFQDLIVAACIEHPEEFVQYGELIISRYFSGVLSSISARVLHDYLGQYGTYPNWTAFENQLRHRLSKINIDESNEDKTSDYVEKLRAHSTELRSPEDVKHVAGQVVEFARNQAMIAAIRKNIELLKDGKDLDIKLCEDAAATGQNLRDIGILLSSQCPEIAEDVVNRVTSKTYGIRTGFPLLDNVWKNGFGPGWLIVPLAPPKRYKTSFCINMALNMAGPSIGVDVLYYTLEISDELAVIRGLCNLAGLSMDYMYGSPEKFKQQAIDRLKMMLTGEILFKHYAARSATIRDIKAHAKMAIAQGLRPRAIFIDYADTVKPSMSHKDKKDHLLQADVYTEARALGHELGCTVIMPDRCNRETVSLAVPNMTSFQGAFEKGGIVDVAFGICATDAEMLNDTLRVFVFLNRHGPALQHFQGKTDKDTFRIELEREIEYNPEEVVQRRRKDGPQKLPDDLQ